MGQSDFVIGSDNFKDLEIHSTQIKSFYYFYDRRRNSLIKRFILLEKPRTKYECHVTLIEKDKKFTPRLQFAIRDRGGRPASRLDNEGGDPDNLKAIVNIEDCHENFWQLVSFLRSLTQIEIPREEFSLVSQQDGEIVRELRKRDSASLVDIIRQLSSTEGLSLSHEDINRLLKRREKLAEFEKALDSDKPELWWQDFFERNKWIFGYGLNYQILKQRQAQPEYGGARFDRRGGQRGDYLTSTAGDISFTVLVEIKTPGTRLLHGETEIRTGAWSLSKPLTDALAQIEANIDKWNKEGSTRVDNRDVLEKELIYTVQPKGIVVIGLLKELKDVRSKRDTFQRFRRSIHGVEIMTFDELFKRAQFIADYKD